MDRAPKYTNSLATIHAATLEAATKSEQQTQREKSISSLAERLRVTPGIDLAYAAAWAMREVAEQTIKTEQAVEKVIQLLDVRVKDTDKLCAAYEEFLDLLKSPSLRGYLNVKARLAKDPKQAAKAEAFKLWQERYAGKYPKLRTNPQFAVECLRRWPVLPSIGTVCNWCTVWSKEARQKSRC